MIELSDLIDAYYYCRKNKRSKLSALTFEINYESNLTELLNEVNNRTYRPDKSIAFVVIKPKPREIFAAQFRDRVLHHLIDIKLRPLIECELIDETCNNRIGKGTEAAIQYARKFLSQCNKNDFVCKIDMKGFFMTISKTRLIDITINFISEKYYAHDKEDIMWLVKTILSDLPHKNCIKQSSEEKWRLVPKNKSLFQLDDDLGIPIGNLLSQLLANFFLNEFDHLCKKLFKYYVRYVDDCVIIDDKSLILNTMPELRKDLAKIGICLHPHKFYLQHISKGVAFVGAVVYPNRIYLHNRTVYNAFHKIQELNNLPITYDNIIKFRSIMNSYLGFMKNRCAYNIRKRLIYTMEHKWWTYFYTKKGFYKIILKHKYTNYELSRTY